MDGGQCGPRSPRGVAVRPHVGFASRGSGAPIPPVRQRAERKVPLGHRSRPQGCGFFFLKPCHLFRRIDLMKVKQPNPATRLVVDPSRNDEFGARVETGEDATPIRRIGGESRSGSFSTTNTTPLPTPNHYEIQSDQKAAPHPSRRRPPRPRRHARHQLHHSGKSHLLGWLGWGDKRRSLLRRWKSFARGLDRRSRRRGSRQLAGAAQPLTRWERDRTLARIASAHKNRFCDLSVTSSEWFI